MSKKIMFLGNHEIVIYNFRKEIIQECLDKGYEVYVSFPYGERVEYFEKIGCTFLDIDINRHSKNIINEFNTLKQYKKMIEKVNPDIIFTFTIKPNLYAGLVASAKRIPFVANITGLGTALERETPFQKLLVNFYKIAFSKVKTVFFQNKENQLFFKRNKISPQKYKLLPGSGVNLEHFQTLPYPHEEKIVFLYIGRVMKEKGIQQFSDAAKYITSKYKNTEFQIIGFSEDEFKEDLLKLKEEGIIRYFGMQTDVRPFIKNAHCIIHPSYYPEGISNVLLESSACGRPIITTNHSGCKETVDNGVNGYIFEPKNSKNLIEKIELFLDLSNEDKKKMGMNGRKKVEREFDRNKVVDAYMHEIAEI